MAITYTCFPSLEVARITKGGFLNVTKSKGDKDMLFNVEKCIQNIYKTYFKKHTLSNIQFKYSSSKRKYMKTITWAWVPKFDKQKLVSSV